MLLAGQKVSFDDASVVTVRVTDDQLMAARG